MAILVVVIKSMPMKPVVRVLGSANLAETKGFGDARRDFRFQTKGMAMRSKVERYIGALELEGSALVGWGSWLRKIGSRGFSATLPLR